MRINACECENLMEKRSNKTIICKWKAFNQSYQSIASWLNTNVRFSNHPINDKCWKIKWLSCCHRINSIIPIITITITQSDNHNVIIYWTLLQSPSKLESLTPHLSNLLFFLASHISDLRLIYDEYAINCKRKQILSVFHFVRRMRCWKSDKSFYSHSPFDHLTK